MGKKHKKKKKTDKTKKAPTAEPELPTPRPAPMLELGLPTLITTPAPAPAPKRWPYIDIPRSRWSADRVDMWTREFEIQSRYVNAWHHAYFGKESRL